MRVGGRVNSGLVLRRICHEKLCVSLEVFNLSCRMSTLQMLSDVRGAKKP